MRFTTRKEVTTMALRKKSAATTPAPVSVSGNSNESSKPKKSKKARKPAPYLPALGAYGFGKLEPVLLAALVTEDPILLIGKSGTGKTFLLNSISEALGLEHRHYNASLISFDDLVGFPYPDEARESVGRGVAGADGVLVLVSPRSRSATMRACATCFLCFFSASLASRNAANSVSSCCCSWLPPLPLPLGFQSSLFCQ